MVASSVKEFKNEKMVSCYAVSYTHLEDLGVVDASIVGSHIMFTVADIGLGTTWIAHFDPAKVRKAYNLPDNIIPVAIFPIGYPHPDCVPAPGHTKRFDVSEFTIYNSF